jgi:hypothetical protein
MARFHGLVLCVVLVGLGSPAAACINDNESPTHEREFRSQYGKLAGLLTMDQFAYQYRGRHDLLIGGGLALLAGAFALATTKGRTRA